VDLATDPCTVSGGQGVNALVLEEGTGIPSSVGDPVDVPWNEERLGRLIETAMEREEAQ